MPSTQTNPDSKLLDQLREQQIQQQATRDATQATLQAATEACQRAQQLHDAIAKITVDFTATSDSTALLNTKVTAILKDFQQGAALFQATVQSAAKAATLAVQAAAQARTAETEFAAAAVARTETEQSVVDQVQQACDAVGAFARAMENFVLAELNASADASARSLDLPDLDQAGKDLTANLGTLQKTATAAAGVATKNLGDANKGTASAHDALNVARTAATKAEAALTGTNTAIDAIQKRAPAKGGADRSKPKTTNEDTITSGDSSAPAASEAKSGTASAAEKK